MARPRYVLPHLHSHFTGQNVVMWRLGNVFYLNAKFGKVFQSASIAYKFQKDMDYIYLLLCLHNLV